MFEIVNNGGTWQVQLAAGKSLDFESATKTYSFSVKATDSTGLTSAATPITVNVTDVNEAPTNVTFKNQQSIQAGVTGAGVQVVDADAIDPDGPLGALVNKFRFENGTQQDGKFTIDADTGQITTNDVITAADAGPKTLTVVTYDPGNPALMAKNDHTINVALPNGFSEPTISIVAQDATKLEGPSNTTAFTFTLTRSSNVGLSTVKMLLVGTGNDPVATSDIHSITVDGSVTNVVEFANTETTKTVTVVVKGDLLDENDEAFSLVLYSPQNATISKTDGIANGVIRDDDNPPDDIFLSTLTPNVRELDGTSTIPGAPSIVVGTLGAHDLDQSSGLTFKLLDSAGGRFKLDASGTQILVDNGFLLDFEQAASHKVKVEVTDNTGKTYVEDLVISVKDWAAEVTAGSVANNVFKGGAGVDNLAGNAGNDLIYGGAGNDKLAGGVGSDKIWGGAGKDTLTGNAGKDFFVFDTFNAKTNKKTNVDTIKDFIVKDDSIYLDNAVFKALGKAGTLTKPAKMNANAFWTGTAAHDKDDRIIYDNKKGILYYDADGTGKGAAVQIATLSNKAKLTVKDFFVV
jgi:Ca2+-binding RTX toxin-like protein